MRLVKLATSNPVTAQLVRTMIRGFAETQLRSGVTTIRTVGGILDYDGKVRDEIDDGYAKRAEAAQNAAGIRGGKVNPLRAARTGLTRIPLGSMAPSGLGAALSGGAASAAAQCRSTGPQDPYLQCRDLCTGRTCCGIARVPGHVPGRGSAICR